MLYIIPMRNENIQTLLVNFDHELQAALDIRRRVFVDGQHVPVELEQDGKDSECTHFVARNGEVALGAARLRPVDETTVKIERMAVLREYRSQGIGRALLDDMLHYARQHGYDQAVLHSQLSAFDFYYTAGFRQIGEVFYEADMPHVKMRMNLHED